MSNSNYSINDDEPCSSSNVICQINQLENTAVISDDFTLIDILQKFKDQVRVMAAKVSQLHQHLNLIKNPANPPTHQEILKIKRNIINGITDLLKETKPLNYPSFQTLSSVQLLKTYEKISSQCNLILNNIQQNNENINKRIDWIKCTSILIKDFQKEVDNILAQNSVSTEVEQKVAQDFKECKSDMYKLLSVNPTLKETLSLLVECNEQDDDSWVNIEDKPHLVVHCNKLKRDGFVLQNEQNKYLFKLNII